ncbi:GNAT family N-acetyltransferase [Streptomyces sp. NPDC059802]|uniref:GNAT family N-acetyltransferase n=1 Tax=Streptomyces sp. NPDC059802 TaxID=3346952 RepID=UPI00365559F8
MTHATGPGLQSAWTMTPAPYDDPEVQQLLLGLYDEQRSMYGFADDPADTPISQFVPPHGLFLLVQDEQGNALGCGGWWFLDTRTAEIKRMYVRPEARAQSLGREILLRLEADAKLRGATCTQLETGVANIAALALYRAQGYTPITSYRPGRNPDVNRALRKDL